MKRANTGSQVMLADGPAELLSARQVASLRARRGYPPWARAKRQVARLEALRGLAVTCLPMSVMAAIVSFPSPVILLRVAAGLLVVAAAFVAIIGTFTLFKDTPEQEQRWGFFALFNLPSAFLVMIWLIWPNRITAILALCVIGLCAALPLITGLMLYFTTPASRVPNEHPRRMLDRFYALIEERELRREGSQDEELTVFMAEGRETPIWPGASIVGANGALTSSARGSFVVLRVRDIAFVRPESFNKKGAKDVIVAYCILNAHHSVEHWDHIGTFPNEQSFITDVESIDAEHNDRRVFRLYDDGWYMEPWGYVCPPLQDFVALRQALAFERPENG